MVLFEGMPESFALACSKYYIKTAQNSFHMPIQEMTITHATNRMATWRVPMRWSKPMFILRRDMSPTIQSSVQGG